MQISAAIDNNVKYNTNIKYKIIQNNNITSVVILKKI